MTSLGRLGCFLDSDFPWLLLLLTILVESLQSARSLRDLKCGEHMAPRSKPFFAFGEANNPCIWNTQHKNSSEQDKKMWLKGTSILSSPKTICCRWKFLLFFPLQHYAINKWLPLTHAHYSFTYAFLNFTSPPTFVCIINYDCWLYYYITCHTLL